MIIWAKIIEWKDLRRKVMSLDNHIKKELKTRTKLKFKNNIVNFEQNKTGQSVIFCSQSDVGVIRNGGRRGASLAPSCLLNAFTNLAQQGPKTIATASSNNNDDQQDFNQYQIKETKLLEKVIDSNPLTLIHLGGGHDLIFPFVKAISKKYKNKIKVLNIDAHLDTRDDSWNHSGTPFRQLINQPSIDLELFQLGIQSFSNDLSSYKFDKKVQMHIKTLDQLRALNYDLF